MASELSLSNEEAPSDNFEIANEHAEKKGCFLISSKSALLLACDMSNGKRSPSSCELHLIALFSAGLFSNYLVNDLGTSGADARVRGSNLLEAYCRAKCFENTESASLRNDLGRMLKSMFDSSPACNGCLSLSSLKLSSEDHSRIIFCKCLRIRKVCAPMRRLACPLISLTGSIIFNYSKCSFQNDA